MESQGARIVTSPSWLPALASVDGEWHEVIRRLHEVFRRDFIRGNPKLRGFPVRWDRRVEEGDRYDEGFWHLVTKKDHASGDRLLDPDRAKRIAWPAAIIDHAGEDCVLAWDYREGSGRIRTYLWLQEEDFVVILERKILKNDGSEAYFLITSYFAAGDSSRRNLRRKHEQREIANAIAAPKDGERSLSTHGR